jgi:hypothetical protein
MARKVYPDPGLQHWFHYRQSLLYTLAPSIAMLGQMQLLFQRPRREQVQAGPHLRACHHGQGPLPWPRAAWQSAHISTVNRPSTLLNGPLKAPQNEQWSAIPSSLEHLFP